MGHLPELITAIVRRNSLQQAFLARSSADLPPDELELLERYIAYCLGRGETIEFLADCYDLIVKDMLTQQLYFQRHKRYRYSRYDEVAASVYHNEAYMTKYMYGLALTVFLWPNHARMWRYFVETLPRDRGGRYLEVGPGHGFFFMSAMRGSKYDFFEGVDISATSAALTRALLAGGAFGEFSRYEVKEGDFLSADFAEPFDALVMGEVLEHVEQPRRFLERLREISRPGAHIFVTTCINSPAFDHIFLFESMEHLTSVVVAAGLTVQESLVLPYQGLSLEESARRRLPVNVAMVLGR